MEELSPRIEKMLEVSGNCGLRLCVAKSCFFKKGATIMIVTDYDNEVFCDNRRTDSLIME